MRLSFFISILYWAMVPSGDQTPHPMLSRQTAYSNSLSVFLENWRVIGAPLRISKVSTFLEKKVFRIFPWNVTRTRATVKSIKLSLVKARAFCGSTEVYWIIFSESIYFILFSPPRLLCKISMKLGVTFNIWCIYVYKYSKNWTSTSMDTLI